MQEDLKKVSPDKMRVLSLFDGMSCGMLALERAGIKVDKYYASEIDKYAIQISKKNHPNVIQVGDVTLLDTKDLGEIDLLIGGSPCQSFSIAGKQEGFNGKSGLFYEYVRILREVKPKYFLLENVKMKKEFQDIISQELGLQPIEINSSLLSAQNRKRLYWTNIPGVQQPKDRGILLKDVLEHKVDEKYYISDEIFERLKNFESNARLSNIEGKSYCLNTMQGGHRQPKILATQVGQSKNFGNSRGNDKGYTLRTSTGNGVIELSDPPKVRKLTPVECERLQTVPDNYTEGVSNSQRYKMLGNGWTVDVVSHILLGLTK